MIASQIRRESSLSVINTFDQTTEPKAVQRLLRCKLSQKMFVLEQRNRQTAEDRKERWRTRTYRNCSDCEALEMCISAPKV